MRVLLLIASIILITISDLQACTSAIITGKLTPNGRPLMWKHRDTGEENNRVEYIKGEKYNFLALVNSPDNTLDAWTGTNSVGFSIMNTASYNLKDDDIANKFMDREGEVMYKALAVCKTLADFEKLLDNYKRPIGVEANFGVIDAEGGAAYYEVNNDSWTKIDVNDPKIAPQGFLVYTNHSYTGRLNEGMGYIRYTNANTILLNKVATGEKITPEWIFKDLSRSFYHSVLGIDLVKDNYLLSKGTGWFIDQDFIPRRSSTASVVIEGVKEGESADRTIMWTILGYPPTSIAVPLFVEAGENQPSFMVKSNESLNAKICDWSLEQKHEVFGIKRGNGKMYLNFNKLYNKEGKGFMQRAVRVEGKMFDISSPIIEDFYKNGLDIAKFNVVYNYVEDNIKYFESIDEMHF